MLRGLGIGMVLGGLPDIAQALGAPPGPSKLLFKMPFPAGLSTTGPGPMLSL